MAAGEHSRRPLSARNGQSARQPENSTAQPQRQPCTAGDDTSQLNGARTLQTAADREGRRDHAAYRHETGTASDSGRGGSEGTDAATERRRCTLIGASQRSLRHRLSAAATWTVAATAAVAVTVAVTVADCGCVEVRWEKYGRSGGRLDSGCCNCHCWLWLLRLRIELLLLLCAAAAAASCFPLDAAQCSVLLLVAAKSAHCSTRVQLLCSRGGSSSSSRRGVAVCACGLCCVCVAVC